MGIARAFDGVEAAPAAASARASADDAQTAGQGVLVGRRRGPWRQRGGGRRRGGVEGGGGFLTIERPRAFHPATPRDKARTYSEGQGEKDGGRRYFWVSPFSLWMNISGRRASIDTDSQERVNIQSTIVV